MNHLRSVIVFCICLSLLLAGLAGCEKNGKETADSNRGSGSSGLQGTIRVSGAWALYPMMVKWGEEFMKRNPQIRVETSAGGAGKGVADALAGLVDIGMVSRDIRQEEASLGVVNFPVVKDAVFPTMNDKNPSLKEILRTGIRRAAFIDLWISGKSLNWSEGTGKKSDALIKVYTRSDACGAAETWAKYLGNKKQEDLKGVAVYGDPGLAEAVRQDIYGIGYNNLNYAYDMKTGIPMQGLQIIPIDVNENGTIDPGEQIDTKQKAIQSVLNGMYPSPPARDLYLVTKGNAKDITKGFITWILTEGQQFVGEVGYIKIAETQRKEAFEKNKKSQ
ncbi:MAG: PstS family phosphate ABC transporter substrate-binding protein [Syntrophorhabdaceae bacterium]